MYCAGAGEEGRQGGSTSAREWLVGLVEEGEEGWGVRHRRAARVWRARAVRREVHVGEGEGLHWKGCDIKHGSVDASLEGGGAQFCCHSTIPKEGKRVPGARHTAQGSTHTRDEGRHGRVVATGHGGGGVGQQQGHLVNICFWHGVGWVNAKAGHEWLRAMVVLLSRRRWCHWLRAHRALWE